MIEPLACFDVELQRGRLSRMLLVFWSGCVALVVAALYGTLSGAFSWLECLFALGASLALLGTFSYAAAEQSSVFVLRLEGRWLHVGRRWRFGWLGEPLHLDPLTLVEAKPVAYPARYGRLDYTRRVIRLAWRDGRRLDLDHTLSDSEAQRAVETVWARVSELNRTPPRHRS
jgi:hypothetical protein